MRFLGAVATRYLSTLVQFAISVLVARELDPHDLGAYLVLYGAVTATYVAAGFGAPDGVVRLAPALAVRVNTDASRVLVGQVVSASLGLSTAIAVACAAVSALFERSLVVGLLFGVWWMGYAAVYVGAQGLVALGRSSLGTFLFYGGANWVTLVVVLGWAVVSEEKGLTGLLVASSAGAAVAGVLSVALLVREIGLDAERFRPRGLGEAIRVGLPLSFARIVQSLIIWSPVWVAGAVFGTSQAASVGLASRLVMAVGAAIAAVRFSVRPAIVRLSVTHDWEEIERISKRVAVGATLLGCFAAICDATLGRYLIPKIFGAAYTAVWWILLIMLFGIIIESMAGVSDEALKLTTGSIFVLNVQLVILLIGAGAQIIAAEIGGVRGVVWTSSISFGLLYLIIVNRYAMLTSTRPALLPVFRSIAT